MMNTAEEGNIEEIVNQLAEFDDEAKQQVTKYDECCRRRKHKKE
jgi:hypothetical protein